VEGCRWQKYKLEAQKHEYECVIIRVKDQEGKKENLSICRKWNKKVLFHRKRTKKIKKSLNFDVKDKFLPLPSFYIFLLKIRSCD